MKEIEYDYIKRIKAIIIKSKVYELCVSSPDKERISSIMKLFVESEEGNFKAWKESISRPHKLGFIIFGIRENELYMYRSNKHDDAEMYKREHKNVDTISDSELIIRMPKKKLEL